MNQVTLVGRITTQPELFKSQAGVNYTKFILEVPKEYANKDGLVEKDEFELTAFKLVAEEIVEKKCKNKLVAVKGKIQANNVSKDNTTYFNTQVLVDRLQFVDAY